MRTNKLFLFFALVIAALGLAACSPTANQDNPTTNISGTSGSQAGSSLSQVNLLLVGTLKLEGTDQEVTAAEAAQLLPLWQAYRSLSNSQTAAQAEVDALLNQIQSSMTSDQVQAIEAMNLSSTEMMDLMQSLGGGMILQGTPNPQSTPGMDIQGEVFQSGNPPSGSFGSPPSGSGSGTTRNPPSGGAIPGGGTGGGFVISGDAGGVEGLGGGPMLQGTPDPSMQATAQARFGTQANQVNSLLLDVLISKLEAKTSE